MPKNFNTLREKMSPAAQARSRELAEKYRAEMPLDELREARAMTQVHLAKILGVNQAAVSKLERRTDMYVSTLQDFVRAMGGELKITARFPEGTVEISQFGFVKKATAGGE
jgi:DNA-binding XRE family transcriptional regulator